MKNIHACKYLPVPGTISMYATTVARTHLLGCYFCVELYHDLVVWFVVRLVICLKKTYLYIHVHVA